MWSLPLAAVGSVLPEAARFGLLGPSHSPLDLALVAFQVRPRRLVVPVLLALVGSYIALTGAQRILAQRRAVESFEPVDAKIESSDYQTRGREGPSQTYKPEIAYEYEFDGETYRSETVFPGGNYDSRDEMGVRRLVDEHTVGDRVTAYVDPDDPDSSYLVEGELRTAWLFVAAGVVVLTIALGLVAYAMNL